MCKIALPRHNITSTWQQVMPRAWLNSRLLAIERRRRRSHPSIETNSNRRAGSGRRVGRICFWKGIRGRICEWIRVLKIRTPRGRGRDRHSENRWKADYNLQKQEPKLPMHALCHDMKKTKARSRILIISNTHVSNHLLSANIHPKQTVESNTRDSEKSFDPDPPLISRAT